MAITKKPWKRPNPKKGRSTKFTSEQKAEAKERAARAGRRYPNLIDNMYVASGGSAKKKH
jgi:hypothetical protein